MMKMLDEPECIEDRWLDEEQQNMSAADIIDYLCTDETYGYGIDQDELEKSEVLKLVNIRYAISLNSSRNIFPQQWTEDVSEETVAGSWNIWMNFREVDIAEESLREIYRQ